MRRALWWGIWSGLFPVLSMAQALEEREHTYTFRVFKHDRASANQLLYMADRETVREVAFRRGQRSEDYRYHGSPTLTFFVEEGIDPETGESRRIPQARVTLSDHAESWLLFFSPRPSTASADDLPLEVLAMPDGKRAFPDDHLRFVNVTGAPLTGVLGQEAIHLLPGASPPLDLRPFYDGAIPVGLGIPNGDDLVPVYAARWRFEAGARRIFFLLPFASPQNPRLLVRELVDFPSLEAMEPLDLPEDVELVPQNE